MPKPRWPDQQRRGQQIKEANKLTSKWFHEKWEQAVNRASSIDFPVVRCKLSASWIGTLQFFGWPICHDQSLPFEDDARNKALLT
jgi:hypothetical protein